MRRPALAIGDRVQVRPLRVPHADAVHVVLDGDTAPVPSLVGYLLQTPVQENL